MTVLRRAALGVLFLLVASSASHADRRYFVQSYTPYLAPAGNLELEVTSIGGWGQGDTTGTSLGNRIELEYGITDRLTGAAYLNYVQPAGGETPLRFDGPSLEFIYRLSDPGRLPVDPAAYLEVRENGDELEVEPKLLLARRIHRLVAVSNIIGEFERHYAGEERGTTEKKLQVTAGLSREIGRVFAFGIEGIYSHVYVDQGEDATSWLAGPTLNFQTPRVQLSLGWHPQISGQPASSGSLNLADFPRSEVRLIVGVGL